MTLVGKRPVQHAATKLDRMLAATPVGNIADLELQLKSLRCMHQKTMRQQELVLLMVWRTGDDFGRKLRAEVWVRIVPEKEGGKQPAQ